MTTDVTDIVQEVPRVLRKAHKVMTPEEYANMPIVGWHEICRNVDGFGGVGIRFLGESRTRSDDN